MSRSSTTFRPAGAEVVKRIRHTRGPGPRVVLTANVHGDELTGVRAVHALDALLGVHLRRGQVTLYPTLNPAGLHARTRVHPSGHDLNRAFPGVRKGNPVERHAHGVWSDLTEEPPDLVVDLHADSSRAIPYAIVDRALSSGKGGHLPERLMQIARTTGLTVLREYPEDEYIRYSLDRSLAGALLNRAGIPALTIEAGPRRYVDDAAVTSMVHAVLRVLRALDLVALDVPVPKPVSTRPWRRAASPRNTQSGFFVEPLPPGASFAEGDVLGRIVDLEGDVVETLHATQSGIVISWADAGWLPAGSAAGTIGVEE